MTENERRKDTEIDILIRKNETLKDDIAELQRKNSELEIELKAMRGAANSYKAEIERLRSCDMQIEVSKKLEAEIETEAYKKFAAMLCGMFEQYETYDRLHTFEILDRIDITLSELSEGKEDEE